MDKPRAPFKGILVAVAVLAAVYLALGFACTVTAATLQDAGRVNREVNREFVYGAPYPRWDGVWDCEDYAVEKGLRLRARGVPAEHLRVWDVALPDGSRHAVLELALASGPVILDNRDPWPFSRREAERRYSDWRPFRVRWP